jgi:ParB family chromosome partitioning protein
MTEPTVHNIPMRTALCDPQKIIVGERLRPLDPEWVAKLERTIAEIGLQTPITVTAELNTGQPHRLVVGAHRLQAVKNLGWPTIPVLLFEGDERAARMWEISENLDRYELTVLERDIQLAEWIRLAEERAAFSAQVDPKIAKDGSTRGRPESGINQAARELGIERKDAQRAAKVGSLSDEAKAAAVEHGLDNNRSASARSGQGPDGRGAGRGAEGAEGAQAAVG